MIAQNLILPNCHLPSIAWFAFALNAEKLLIEKHEHFVKSTERNRASIAGTNGILRISVPVEGGKSHRQLFKDVRISYDSRWQKIHWQTLCSCYRRSAYFEYYEEKLAPFYEKKFPFLFDFNMELLQAIFSMMKHVQKFSFTDNYQKHHSENIDLRHHFKSNSDVHFVNFEFSSPQYFQCFAKNTGFLQNLSVLDILFSEGPNAKTIIQQSLKMKL